jgi:hypothetical protein
MDMHDVDAAEGTLARHQTTTPNVKPSATHKTHPASDAIHDPEDPLRNSNHANLADNEKYNSHSDSDIREGDVSDIQNASKRPNKEETSGRKGLTTSQAAIIFVTNEVGIGMLSLPSALKTLGFFPGLVCIVIMGMLSLYTAYNLIQYWRKYPWMLSIVDYGRVLGGPWVEGIFAVGFLINMALISASALVTLTIGLNTVSEHATCTVVFTVISALAMWAMCVPQSMRFVSWASWPCTISIIATVLIVMITLGVQGPRDASAPLNLKAIGDPTFTEAVSAFLNVAFAFAGNQVIQSSHRLLYPTLTQPGFPHGFGADGKPFKRLPPCCYHREVRLYSHLRYRRGNRIRSFRGASSIPCPWIATTDHGQGILRCLVHRNAWHWSRLWHDIGPLLAHLLHALHRSRDRQQNGKPRSGCLRFISGTSI